MIILYIYFMFIHSFPLILLYMNYTLITCVETYPQTCGSIEMQWNPCGDACAGKVVIAAHVAVVGERSPPFPQL